jgi:hypothetical protein
VYASDVPSPWQERQRQAEDLDALAEMIEAMHPTSSVPDGRHG